MKKNGFTLIELVITVLLIVLVGMLAVPRIRTLISNSKQSGYETIVDTIEDAAQSYTYLNSSTIDALIDSNGYADVTLLTLQQNGLLKTDIINPLTDTEIPTSDMVRITKTGNTYIYNYLGDD